jgi:hypothetical protein
VTSSYGKPHRTLALVCQALFLISLTACGGGKESAVRLGSVYPTRGTALGGTQIQLEGEGFSSPDTRVMVDGLDCRTVTVVSPSTLTCVAPAHAQGNVDIQVVTADGRRATKAAGYRYRPSGNGVSSFGIVMTAPAQGAHPEPFSVTLESIIAGFDGSTMARSWVIDGNPHSEGESVRFEAGSHKVSLTVQDATGDSDSVSLALVVGQAGAADSQAPVDPGLQAGQATDDTFAVSPGKSIAVVNTSALPLLNPRFIGEGKPDYVDWARYLNSLAQLDGLSTDPAEASRAALLEAAWKDLSNSTVHICSPGREAENIYDPVQLVRGYGYECCSNAARALAYVGAFLDFPARVRTTASHEFPEFTVGGDMFILDPDLRFRFWGDDQRPLSAWTTDSTAVSLMNVDHYYAQTPGGGLYETGSGGTLPFGGNAAFPEQTIRSYYSTNIISESIWGFHEAFTNPSYVLYPNERMAFRQDSAYAPLRWMNSDGSAQDANHAPAVGKVVFQRLWSANGPRTFEKDGDGNSIIPLDDVPYPVQDLVFNFSKPIDPQAFWLTAGGEVYRIGDFTANTWTVSAQQLRVLRKVSGLAAVISGSQDMVAVDIGMQFNPKIFGTPDAPASVAYADDSATCQRTLRVTSGSDVQDVALGSSACDAESPQHVETSHGLSMAAAAPSVISSYGSAYQGTWGLVAWPGVQASAEISLPRTPGLPGLLRATNEGAFADWQAYENGSWTPLSTTDVATSQWIALPATSDSTTRLRLTLRQAPLAETTFLSYLSLVEERDGGHLPFGSPSTTSLQ